MRTHRLSFFLFPCYTFLKEVNHMKETILAFGCEGLLPLLNRAFAPVAVSVRPVPTADCAQTLGALAGEFGCPRAPVVNEMPFPEPMLVLCGFQNARIDAALTALQSAGLNLPYKAVLTKANKKWTPVQLLGELRRERTEMEKSK